MKQVIAIALLFILAIPANSAPWNMSAVQEMRAGVSSDAHQEFSSMILGAYREMFLAAHAPGSGDAKGLYECVTSLDLENDYLMLMLFSKNTTNPNQSVAHWYHGVLLKACRKD